MGAFDFESFRDAWVDKTEPGEINHEADEGMSEYVNATRTQDGRLALEVGYYDHDDYTRCRDGGGDGGAVEFNFAVDEFAFDVEAYVENKSESWQEGKTADAYRDLVGWLGESNVEVPDALPELSV